MNEPVRKQPSVNETADLDAAIAELWGEAGRVEFIEANGIRFEVGVMGDGPKLALCLHGFPEHFISWRHQAPLLAERGYTVWAPNLRGYGRTDRPTAVRAYRLKTLMADVAGLWDAGAARGLSPSLLMAHDWGAIIAWAFVLNRV
ncbi:MAG: alpha/beta fold hydrolase, partial [Pseudomonadota bacterium]